MIVGHICQWADVEYHGSRLFYFFMPWFFYKSGMFFKKNDTHVQLKKDARHLLIPFLSFSVVGQLFLWINLMVQGDTNWLHYISFPKWLILYGSIPANLLLWFLLSLFIVKTTYNAAIGRIPDIYLIIISLAVAFLHNHLGLDAPRYLANGALGLVFFILGFMMKSLQYKSKIIVGIAVAVYAVSIAWPANINMFGNTLLNGWYLLAVVYTLAGIIVINKIAKITPPHLVTH